MKLIQTIVFVVFALITAAQNPIVPAGMYIADPEAHVWNDGKIYVYGSRDESDDYWCSYRHHVLFSDDLKEWNVVENAFASKGEFDEVNYHDRLLFAPDCAYKNGTYYLYYCSPKLLTEGVATSKSPLGPFTNGTEIKGPTQIDPAVLVDNDGKAYYFWGQQKSKVALLADDMLSIVQSSVKIALDEAGNKAFHEGSSIRKIGNLYYLVFADESRNGRPTCLGYATSKNPMGPYKYKGIIIDNAGCDPAVWNNHGSIEKFKNQWYVFYHRSTHNSQKFRKACLEPITINADGTIDEVEMTTQGAGPAIKASKVMEAERACKLSGQVFIQNIKESEKPNEKLTRIYNDDWAVYKYIRFTAENKFRVKTFGSGKGTIEIRLDNFRGKKIGECKVNTPESKLAFQLSECVVKQVTGKHALYLVFKGSGELNFDVDWFQFY